MFRFLLRILGFLLVAIAFATLVVDGSRSIAGGRVLFYTLGDAAAWLGGAQGGGAAAGPAGWPESARRLAAGLLGVPASPLTGTLGLLLLFAGRPADAEPGFSGRET